MNRLGLEKSPYLLQHAENPIWWRPWGPEAFEAAKRENKPVFLSIGYSSCYWCHFMEKDSFEKKDVAELLNKHFIAIKVDREERPDVDNIYMTALVSMTGQGGWPMSMFLTPEGKPFFGASTIPHDNFMALLDQIASVWKTDSAEIHKAGQTVTEGLSRHLNPKTDKVDVTASALRDFLEEMKSHFDERHAGFGGGNKFPRPHLFSALLRIHRRSNDADALRMTVKTLKAISRGGIHDLLAGGFHRYSVDSQWDVPHFEKMLYDNAGLAVAYLEAYQVTGESEFARVARMTLDWTLAEMTDPAGGFYSSQDAGDFDEEGDYYAWTYDELKNLLAPDEFSFIEKIFQVNRGGNFEGGRTVFHVPNECEIPDPASNTLYAAARAKLVKERAKRKRPRLDDKVMTDWNGLMIAAMAKGYQVLGDEKYQRAAQRAASFIREKMTTREGLLLHRWRDGDAAKRAMLDDYAFLIHGLIELYQSDFDPKWFDWAHDLHSRQDELFWDEKNGAYFFDDANDPTLIARAKDFEDMALPSGNSISALNLLRLSGFTHDDELRARATRIFSAAAPLLTRAPSAIPMMMTALDYATDRAKEIAVIGPRDSEAAKKMIAAIRTRFNPNTVTAWSDGKTTSARLKLSEGKSAAKNMPTAFVCEKGVCKLPATTFDELVRQISDFHPLKW